MNEPLAFSDPLGLICSGSDGKGKDVVPCTNGNFGHGWSNNFTYTTWTWNPPVNHGAVGDGGWTEPRFYDIKTYIFTPGDWSNPTTASNKTIVRTIKANNAGLKKKYCDDSFNIVLLKGIIPGGDVVAGVIYGNLRASAITDFAATQGVDKVLEVAGASTAFKSWLRSATGIPMSTTAKLAGRISLALTAIDALKTLNDSINEYQACMGR